MTIEEVIKIAKGLRTDFKCESDTMVDFCNTIIKALEQQTCEDCISRQAVLDSFWKLDTELRPSAIDAIVNMINNLPSVTQKEKIGHCKECKYFEYDNVIKVDGIPLILAHEICSRWGDGCKTKEDGYCFLFEPQEGENKEIENGQNKIRTLGKAESQQR